MSYPKEPLLKSVNFQEVFAIAKELDKDGYEVRLTSNGGRYVYIVNGLPMIRTAGKLEEYKITISDLYSDDTWGLGYRQKGTHGAYLGIVDYRKKIAGIKEVETEGDADDTEIQEA